ncbi:MAG: selenium-dependent molybdenum cofactor biosynthesis protein YqeB [Tissierellia bacterium]|nr:selenium-dependent molybdenum cofactor biosynthesis protein YqeB [Tissierellia bacterium]
MAAPLIIVRGGGDVATGVIEKLHRVGFSLLVLEAPKPTAIRRGVALCEAIYEGRYRVESMEAVRVELGDRDTIEKLWKEHLIPIAIDPEGIAIETYHPTAVIDGILAKRNLGTHRGMAPITMGLGPGFVAGKDVDVVIETMRGHDLGRLIFEGAAMEDTGVPGEIAGFGRERVLHAPCEGIFQGVSSIGDFVAKGQVVARVGNTPVKSKIDGMVRGLLRSGLLVHQGMKVADVDARKNKSSCYTISDKARTVGGAALEALFYKMRIYCQG